MNAGTIIHLLSLDGLPLIDATAAATGQPQVPSEIARPLISVKPNTLDSMQGKWASSANSLENGMAELQQTVALVLDEWNTPESFQDYTSKIHEVLDKQKEAMLELDGIMKNLQATLQTAKQEASDSVEATTRAIRNMLIGAVVGVVTGSLNGALIGILVGLVTWFIEKNDALTKRVNKEFDAIDGNIRKLTDMISGQHLRDITPPSPPPVKWLGYHSIHELS